MHVVISRSCAHKPHLSPLALRGTAVAQDVHVGWTERIMGQQL